MHEDRAGDAEAKPRVARTEVASIEAIGMAAEEQDLVDSEAAAALPSGTRTHVRIAAASDRYQAPVNRDQ